MDSHKREPRLGTSPAVAIGLVGVMVTLAALASAQSLWGVGKFQVAYGLLGLITLAATVLAVRRWGIVYRGWRPYPTYAERRVAEQEREIAEIKRAANRRDAIDETFVELARQDQLLRIELQEGRMYGALHDDTKWRKWEATLFSEGLLDEIALTKKAHQLLRAISEEKRQRGLMADENDPNSMRLTDQDSRARAEAAPIIASALEALHAAQEKGP